MAFKHPVVSSSFYLLFMTPEIKWGCGKQFFGQVLWWKTVTNWTKAQIFFLRGTMCKNIWTAVFSAHKEIRQEIAPHVWEKINNTQKTVFHLWRWHVKFQCHRGPAHSSLVWRFKFRGPILLPEKSDQNDGNTEEHEKMYRLFWHHSWRLCFQQQNMFLRQKLSRHWTTLSNTASKAQIVFLQENLTLFYNFVSSAPFVLLELQPEWADEESQNMEPTAHLFVNITPKFQGDVKIQDTWLAFPQKKAWPPLHRKRKHIEQVNQLKPRPTEKKTPKFQTVRSRFRQENNRCASRNGRCEQVASG